MISTPGPTPTPSPAPSPTPSPSPTPTPAASFDTPEFRRSDGPGFHNAPTAWAQGATGSGVKIAVVDTGIDTDSPEFAGRLDPASSDVAGNGTVEAFDDHGTNVGMIAAAARNSTGIMGIAFDATVIALRADEPGSCASSTSTTDGCVFKDRDIAAGIDRAVAAGATVINLSLGGDAPSASLLNAVQRAVTAGVVIVVAAGNEGDGSDPAIDPNQPNPFAAGVRNAGGANVIIVGSVDDAGRFSSFSNRAGSQANWFLSALGERVCCVYENGVLKVESGPSGNFVTVLSGTSFSAPQVAGAVALLKQAFPNLTGAQMVDILLRSARDAGAIGIDTTYGRGILDIAAAFAPMGTTTLAGGTTAVALNDDTAIGSAPMGDALLRASAHTVILDSYGRAYGTDLGQGMHDAAAAPRLLGALDQGARRVGGGSESLSLAFSVASQTGGRGAWPAQLRLERQDAEAARVLAARAATVLAPGKRLGFAFREGADGLVAQLQGQHRPAFLIAGDARGGPGFAARGQAALAYRQEFGRWGLTANAERGSAWLGTLRVMDGALGRRREAHGLSSFGLEADRRFGNVEAALGLTWLNEERTVLGAFFHDVVGAGGARTLFADARVGWKIAEGWRLGGTARQGWTRADHAGAIGAGSEFISRAWSLDLAKRGFATARDSLAVRISQPLRVESGGLSLNLPVGYDYATLSPTYGVRTIALSPSGREIDGEIAWAGHLFGGSAAASLFYRRDPAHVASAPDDKGVAVRWTKAF
ncbi:S8 family serine peptidase [Tsuneonella sp. YG55]|uniref:S8 family serine peptidase n=1 Tax=Tsuneonella litorea TaxID=2976475 RepID=A0A9X2W078_9SPHN|nr:S8 family peptidase [Tsuneonella litorea]MCT2558503.1 S8 family serine peptidase [Tsuneonella litorea]